METNQMWLKNALQERIDRLKREQEQMPSAVKGLNNEPTLVDTPILGLTIPTYKANDNGKE
ncbi:MAG: hypothetical protein WCG93_13215 [Paludibacter sp.]